MYACIYTHAIENVLFFFYMLCLNKEMLTIHYKYACLYIVIHMYVCSYVLYCMYVVMYRHNDYSCILFHSLFVMLFC